MLYLQHNLRKMGVFKLQLEDFNTTKFELIAIHTTIEVTKLAFLLNKKLHSRFHYFDAIEKKEKKRKGSFERYFFDDEENEICWNLLQNKSIINGGGFDDVFLNQFGQIMHLIPEFNKADYILKIETEDGFFDINEILQKISTIKTITLSYKIDKTKIKTISNLIF